MYENFGGRYIESNDLPSRSGSNSYVAGQLQTLLSQEMENHTNGVQQVLIATIVQD